MGSIIDRDLYFARIGYKPHPTQYLYHDSMSRFRVAVCGRRYGKSKMVATDLEPKLFEPKKRFWAIGSTYDLAEKEFRVIWDDLIIGQKFGRDKRIKKAYNKRSGEMFIEFPWQTRLECRSSAHPETLVGESLDGAIISEAAKHSPETWERFIRPALSDKRGFADFVTTPDGLNWLYYIYMLGLNPKYKGLYESWCFPSWLNTVVFPGGKDDPEIQLLRDTMSMEEFEQEIAASFSSFKGKIYSEFSEKHHVREVKFDPKLPNYIGFDWGFTSPLAAVEFQVDAWDRVRVWREHYKAYMMLDDHILEMKNRAQPDGYRIDLCFGDAADPDAAAVVSRDFAPCLALPEAKKNWRAGVETVKRFLKLRQTGVLDEYGTPFEEPLLTIDFSCVNTIREFHNYKRKPGNGAPVESGAAGAAQKQDDHCLVGSILVDTLRGKVPIKDVEIGDYALTRFGYKQVIDSWLVSEFTKVYKLEMSNGEVLIGTGNHRVWVENSGWVRLDSLRYGDILAPWTHQMHIDKLDQLGEGSEGQSLRDIIFTTKIGTLGTTTSRILNAYLKKITIRNIKKKLEHKEQLLNGLTTWQKLDPFRSVGIAQKKAMNFMLRTVIKPGKIEFLRNASAINANLSMSLSRCAKTIDFVAANAKAHGEGHRALTTSYGNAITAEKTSRQVDIQKVGVAHVYVDSVTVVDGEQAVYDLTVADAHEFVANGIVVHNSLDSLRYSLVTLFDLGANSHLGDAMPETITSSVGDSGYFTTGMRF